jgi:hypothetical protein
MYPTLDPSQRGARFNGGERVNTWASLEARRYGRAWRVKRNVPRTSICCMRSNRAVES